MKIPFNIIVLLLLSVNAFAQNSIGSFEYEKKQDYSDVVVFSRDIDSTVTFEKIVIQGYDSKLPFYHYSNRRNESGQYVILLHGLGSSKEDWVYPSMPYFQWTKNLTAIKDSLLTRGFNIIIPDAKFHGERIHELNFRPPEQLPPIRSHSIEDSKTFASLMSTTIKDVRIIMDYIEHKYKISQAKFSLAGYSMGGALAIILNALDTRISSVVACVPPLEKPEKEVAGWNWPKEVVLALATISPNHYASQQKSPIQLLLGDEDPAYTDEKVTSFVNDIPFAEKEITYFESGHELPNDYVQHVIDWIIKYSK